MANKMLIDASHPEETRVVVLRGNRVEEFDFESANKKQLRGNIYLAKVTRVEPSLQAAFVDYGGNRHGFLAFSEIHPDYYQIPVGDRQALIEEEARAERDEEQEEARGARRSRRHRRNDHSEIAEKRRASEDETLPDTRDAEFESEPLSARSAEEEADDLTEEASDAATGWREPADEDRDIAPEALAAADEAAEAESEPHKARITAEAQSEAASNPADFAPAALANAKPAGHETDLEAAQADLQEDLQEDLEETSETFDPAHVAENAVHRFTTDPEGFAVVEEQDDNGEESGPSAEAETRFRPVREHEDEDEGDEEADQVEQLGGDAMEEVPIRAHRGRRQYKIQEVIKRRQVLLVQVVKEERGNKGAALTTYLSLAGRYSVLMPNTARGGGISRKITDANDRQRLKAIAQELEVPEGMGVILRTAGAARTKAEVKRDFEYLLRMWETVREMTLKSTAPTLVYEEGSLVKRAIRDLYNKDIDEVVVSGDNGYREAKEFMRMLMPSHAKNVQPYREPQPIFTKYGVEAQLDAMFSNQVTLKSGGYLVINQTEALVAIDVNSGRSTREHNIEDTALRTNLEASDEIARQLRLRDLAGLIVIDLIDMEETRNNRAVERRLKEALKNDRARIQIGRISHFGLLEMSRQRMRTGVLEGSTILCPHCAGAGMVRSTSSIALHVLRILEEALIKNAAHNISVRTRTEVALYILNQKRGNLRDLERRFGVSITIAADDSLTGTAYHALERGEPAVGVVEAAPRLEAPRPVEIHVPVDDEGLAEDDGESLDADGEALGEDDRDGDQARKRRRRRRRRGRGTDRETSGVPANAPQPSDDALGRIANIEAFRIEATPEHSSATVEETEDETEELRRGPREESAPRREGRRRRPRRKGRGFENGFDDRGEETNGQTVVEPASEPHALEPELPASELPISEAADHVTAPQMEAPPGSAETSAPALLVQEAETARETTPSFEAIASETPPVEPEFVQTDRFDLPETGHRIDLPEAGHQAAIPAETAPIVAEAKDESISHYAEIIPSSEPEPSRPKRTGWWQRAKASLRG